MARLRAFGSRHVTFIMFALTIIWGAAVIYADVRISGQSTPAANQWFVNSNGVGLIQHGNSARATYKAVTSAQACTAAVVLSIESSAGTGFKLAKWCATTSPATADAAVTMLVQRRTTASSGGTALTAEGTAAPAISKMDPADGNYPGVARTGGTPGTAGAVLDSVAWTTGELGAGAADPGSKPFCMDYGEQGGKMPTVVSGITSGVSLTLSSAGAGALSACVISATVIAE